MVSRNSIPGGITYIWQSKWLGIIAIKTASTQINFLTDVLVAVASLDLKVPNVFRRQRYFHLIIITAKDNIFWQKK